VDHHPATRSRVGDERTFLAWDEGDFGNSQIRGFPRTKGQRRCGLQRRADRRERVGLKPRHRRTLGHLERRPGVLHGDLPSHAT